MVRKVLGLMVALTCSFRANMASMTNVAVGASLSNINEFPGTINDMAFEFKFDLSPGDLVSLKSYFEISPVPIPAAGWLFATGLIMLVRVKKTLL